MRINDVVLPPARYMKMKSNYNSQLLTSCCTWLVQLLAAAQQQPQAAYGIPVLWSCAVCYCMLHQQCYNSSLYKKRSMQQSCPSVFVFPPIRYISVLSVVLHLPAKSEFLCPVRRSLVFPPHYYAKFQRQYQLYVREKIQVTGNEESRRRWRQRAAAGRGRGIKTTSIVPGCRRA